jgi:hypothetical protein
MNYDIGKEMNDLLYDYENGQHLRRLYQANMKDIADWVHRAAMAIMHVNNNRENEGSAYDN